MSSDISPEWCGTFFLSALPEQTWQLSHLVFLSFNFLEITSADISVSDTISLHFQWNLLFFLILSFQTGCQSSENSNYLGYKWPSNLWTQTSKHFDCIYVLSKVPNRKQSACFFINKTYYRSSVVWSVRSSLRTTLFPEDCVIRRQKRDPG